MKELLELEFTTELKYRLIKIINQLQDDVYVKEKIYDDLYQLMKRIDDEERSYFT